MGAHGVHGLLVLLGLVGLAALLAPQVALHRRARDLRALADSGTLVRVAEERAATTPVPRLVLAAAAASVGAGWVHAAVTGPALRESLALGALFLGTAALQTAWAGAVTTRPSRRLLRAGVLGNAAVVVVWAASRLVALPLSSGREPVGGWDLLATTYELAVVTCCLHVLTSGAPSEGQARRASRAGLLLAPVVALVLLAVGARS